jgi:peroxiredoxin
MKKVIVLFSLVLVLFNGTSSAQDVGNPAPNFSFNALDGGSFTLSEQTDKVVMIFAFGYNCPYCLSSGPLIQEHLVDAYQGNEDYVAVGIDIWNGAEGSVTTFKNSTGLTMPLLLNGSSFASDYNSLQDKLYVVDKRGNLVHRTSLSSSAISDYPNVVAIVDEELSGVNAVENTSFDNILLQVYPNPIVGNEVNLSFNLAEGGFVDAIIISTDGKTVLKPIAGDYVQGKNQQTIDIGSLSSGVYFLVLNINGKKIYRKILVD